MAATSNPWRMISNCIAAFAVLVFLYLTLPTLIVVLQSFSDRSYLSMPPPGLSLRWYEALAADPKYPDALLNSLRVGIPAALLSTMLGTLAALGVNRGRFAGRRLMSLLFIAPMILPPIILAVGLFPIMSRLGIIGTYWAILLGHVVVCLPLVFITVTAALRSINPSYELAAMTLGADWWNTFRHVTLPMIRGSMIIGFIFAFTFSFDEIILAIFLTNSVTRTLPRLLWEQLSYQMTPIIAAAAVVIMIGTIVVVVMAGLVQSRTRRAG